MGNGVGPIIGSPALAREYEGSLVGHNVLVRLTDGAAGSPAFGRRLDQLQDRAATDDTGREFGVMQALFPTTDDDPAVRAARQTLVAGLIVFVVIAAAGGLLAIGQALSRHHAAGAADQQVEAALGLTRAERVLARMRTGPARGVDRSRPRGGRSAARRARGAARTAGRLRAGAGLAAGRRGRGTQRHRRGTGVPAAIGGYRGSRGALRDRALRSLSSPRLLALPRLGRGAPVVAGLSFALRGYRGRSGVPVRATALVAVVGVAGVVAVASFAASLDRLTKAPERYGWIADFAIVDAKADDAAALAADPRIAAVAVIDATNVNVDGRRTVGASVRKAVGDVPVPLLSGRLPVRAGETALGSREARRLGAGIGDRVTLRTYDEKGERVPRSLRVVGVAVTPEMSDEGLGGIVLLWPGDLRKAIRTVAFSQGLVEVKPGADVDALYRDLSARLEMGRASQPAQVRNLAALGRLPQFSQCSWRSSLSSYSRTRWCSPCAAGARPRRAAGHRADAAPGRPQRRRHGGHVDRDRPGGGAAAGRGDRPRRVVGGGVGDRRGRRPRAAVVAAGGRAAGGTADHDAGRSRAGVARRNPRPAAVLRSE